MKNKTDITLLFFLILAGIIACMLLGQDANWDLANYHYYSVWALFNNRIGFDIMPCGIQSYFNPLIDMPLYFLIKFLNNHSRLICSIQSIWWGLAVFFGYKIAALIFNGKRKKLLIILSVIIGSTGILSALGIGMSFGDVNIAAIVLCAIFIFLKNVFSENTKKRMLWIFTSALLIGFSIGLKTSGIMCAAGLIISEFLMFKKYQKPCKIIGITFLGIITGALITGGWWHLLIFQKFGNPFFPFYNDFFQSPMAEAIKYIDIRHLPKSIIQYLFYPIYWTFHNNENAVLEFSAFDMRSMFVFISVVMIITGNILQNAFSLKNKDLKNIINVDVLNYLTFMIAGTYIFWLNTSGTLRYLQYIEILSGIFITVIFVYLSIFIKSSKTILILGISVFCFILFSTKYCDTHITRIIFNNKFLNFENLKIPDNSVLLYLGGFPGAIYMPFQNHNIRFVYLYGEIDNYNFVYPAAEEKRIKTIIDEAKENVYLLYSEYEPAYIDWEYISRFINKDDFVCRSAENNFAQFYYFCKLKTDEKN